VKKRIAFFDFDGTITTKDTLLEFIKYSKGALLFYFGFLVNSPYLLAYKLKIISNQLAKEKVLKFFFGNMPVGLFNEKCSAFSINNIPGLIRPEALEEIRKLRKSGTVVVIVSASPENWIRQWAGELQVPLLATQLETKHDKISGRIAGKNCHGEEKVRRIREAFTLTDYDDITAYGDTMGDLPMLGLANRRFFKPFRGKNALQAGQELPLKFHETLSKS
jgi:phosphatidylglycerophosphatase C